jgi:hypothetical protein
MTVREQLYEALAQLLAEVEAAGFRTATDYNWPKAIADAQNAMARAQDPISLAQDPEESAA